MQINRAFLRPAFIPAMLAPMLALSGCGETVPRADERQPMHPSPAPALVRQPPRAPVVATVPPALVIAPPTPDWRDMPLTAGDWTWTPRLQGSMARFGVSGMTPAALLLCERLDGVVRIALPYEPRSAPPAQATITTSTTSATVPIERQVIEGQPTLTIALPASHRLLDAMAFSRGRFVIRVDGIKWVVLPSWSEVGRVIEDCRS